MEQEKEKDGNYALNTLKDIWKYDPARLLDLGNTFQVLLTQKDPKTNEEVRAITNFEKLTEDSRRPIKHTLADAARLLPDIITLASGPGYAAIKQTVTKNSAKKLGKEVAEKLVAETSSEAADAFNKSLFLPKELKNKAGKRWVRELYENEDAMKRIAGRDLKADEVKAIKKSLLGSIEEKIVKQNDNLDEIADDMQQMVVSLHEMFNNTKWDDPFYKQKAQAIQELVIQNGFDDVDTLAKYKNFIARESGLGKDRVQRIIDNLDALPAGHRARAELEYAADDILKNIPKQKTDKWSKVKEVGKDVFNPVHTGLVGADALAATANSLGKNAKELVTRNKGLEMKPDYWTLGSEPTPVSDFIASVFNVDFDDPARFNKKDIDVFFDFLEDEGAIEPGIKDKWSPRQKVSVMREMLSNKYYGPFIKGRWAKSKHKQDLTKYYNGE